MKKLLITFSLILTILPGTAVFAFHYHHHMNKPDQNKVLTSVLLDVPFTSQAPYGDWKLPYAEACEEASMVMVDHYLNGSSLDPDTANNEIVNLVNWEEQNGYGVDVSAQQTADILGAYFGRRATVYTDGDVTVKKIKNFLDSGSPVIVPAAGRMLRNPNFRGGGPLYHMVVVIGYEGANFYVHDPGSSHGKAYRYNQSVLYNAIHDWNGSKSKTRDGRKAIVVVE